MPARFLHLGSREDGGKCGGIELAGQESAFDVFLGPELLWHVPSFQKHAVDQLTKTDRRRFPRILPLLHPFSRHQVEISTADAVPLGKPLADEDDGDL